jgi:acyl-homoserine-lactone acylase
MLLANPHLAWADLQLFYESHWNLGKLNAYGTSLIGFPTLAIAFNDSLGWSHTVNTYDGEDHYRLTKVEGGYRFDGQVKPFETATEVIKVKQADGSLKDDTLVIRRSVHGPVVADSVKTAIALRVAGLDKPGMLEEWWDLTRATNLTEFQGILKRLAIPMFNVIYADRVGHIYYLYGGQVPRRSRGDVAYWAGTVPGDTSATLWNSTLSYDELPHLTDPATGWLQNANDAPWTVTVPLPFKRDSFPAYLAPTGMAFRPERSARMLWQDSSITFDELVAYKHSTRMELADRILDELVAAARKQGGANAKRAADVLEKWDRQAQATSRGAVLFTFWVQAWAQASGGPAKMFTVPWRADSALTTPHGLGNPAVAVKALEGAAAQVEKAYGSLDVPYGDVMRLRYRGKDLPGNGAAGDPLGVFRTAYYVPDKDGKFRIAGGDTYYSTVEFGDSIRARVLTGYGNATQPGNKHVADQLDLFAKQEMREVWRTRAQVEAHLESKISIK